MPTVDPWELGDEALTVDPVFANSGPRGVKKRLTALAKSRGVALQSLRIYRGVANAWPQGRRRLDLPFAVHAVFRDQPDRFDLIKERDWTVADATAFKKARSAETPSA